MRRARKEQRLTKNKQLDTREGPQYETGLGYRCEDESGEQIPPPFQSPENKEVSLAKVNTKVVFDLETSSQGSLPKGKGNQLVSLVLRILIEKIVNVRELRGIYTLYTCNCIP